MAVLAREWWAFVVRGVAAILFGVLTMLLPGLALLTLILLFGFYAVADGVAHLVAFFRSAKGAQKPWPLLIAGIVGVLAGLIAFLMPGLTAIALLYLMAGWAIVTGILMVGAAVRLRKEIKGEWVLVLSGLLSIAFGVLVGLFPGAGALAVTLWIGAYAIVLGALLIAVGFRTRKLVKVLEHGAPSAGQVAGAH